MILCYSKVIGASLSEPTLAVVDSTVVRWSRCRKFTLVAWKDWSRTWYIHELKLHTEERE